jgi:hypothetical protein
MPPKTRAKQPTIVQPADTLATKGKVIAAIIIDENDTMSLTFTEERPGGKQHAHTVAYSLYIEYIQQEINKLQLSGTELTAAVGRVIHKINTTKLSLVALGLPTEQDNQTIDKFYQEGLRLILKIWLKKLENDALFERLDKSNIDHKTKINLKNQCNQKHRLFALQNIGKLFLEFQNAIPYATFPSSGDERSGPEVKKALNFFREPEKNDEQKKVENAEVLLDLPEYKALEDPKKRCEIFAYIIANHLHTLYKAFPDQFNFENEESCLRNFNAENFLRKFVGHINKKKYIPKKDHEIILKSTLTAFTILDSAPPPLSRSLSNSKIDIVREPSSTGSQARSEQLSPTRLEQSSSAAQFAPPPVLSNRQLLKQSLSSGLGLSPPGTPARLEQLSPPESPARPEQSSPPIQFVAPPVLYNRKPLKQFLSSGGELSQPGSQARSEQSSPAAQFTTSSVPPTTAPSKKKS